MRRRRQLAAPFVVLTACSGAPGRTNNPPPPEQPPEQPPEAYDQNGDKLDKQVVVNPPPPELPDPPADGKGEVTTRDDGTCWYFETIECPSGAKCNPPPPLQVKCPPDRE